MIWLNFGLHDGSEGNWSEGKNAIESGHGSHKRLDSGRNTDCSEGRVALDSGHWSH